jgi:NIPSNAP
MKRRTLLMAAPLAVLAPFEIVEAMRSTFASVVHENLAMGKSEQGGAIGGSTVVYELRIYHVVPGKLDSLVSRFRDYTDKLFAKHGMKSVAYWTALDEPVKSSTFFYILEHPSREVAAANWKAFQDDQEWKTVKAKSEENGKLVEKIDSTFLTLTDFPSPPRL